MRGGCSACQVCTASTNAPPTASTALVTAAVVSTVVFQYVLERAGPFLSLVSLYTQCCAGPHPCQLNPTGAGSLSGAKPTGPQPCRRALGSQSHCGLEAP